MDKILEDTMFHAIRNNPEMLNLISEYNRSGLDIKDFIFIKSYEKNLDLIGMISILKI